jgi:hypothetical protein
MATECFNVDVEFPELDVKFPPNGKIERSTAQNLTRVFPSRVGTIRRVESIDGTVYDIRSGALAGTITVKVMPIDVMNNDIWYCTRSISHSDVIMFSFQKDDYGVWAYIDLANREQWRCLLKPHLSWLERVAAGTA